MPTVECSTCSRSVSIWERLLLTDSAVIAVENCRAAVVGKNATRRRISRIILASVVNASNRRRRGLEGLKLLVRRQAGGENRQT